MPQYNIRIMPQKVILTAHLDEMTQVKELLEYIKSEFQSKISTWICQDEVTGQTYLHTQAIPVNINKLLIITTEVQHSEQYQQIFQNGSIGRNSTSEPIEGQTNQNNFQLNENLKQIYMPECKLHNEKINYLQLTGDATFLCDDCICEMKDLDYIPLKKFVKTYNELANKFESSFQEDQIDQLKKLTKELVSNIESKFQNFIETFKSLKHNVFHTIKAEVGTYQIFTLSLEQRNLIRNVFLTYNQEGQNAIQLLHQRNEKVFDALLNQFQETCEKTKEKFNEFSISKIKMDPNDLKLKDGKLFFKNQDLMMHNASNLKNPIFDINSVLQNKIFANKIPNEIKLKVQIKESNQPSTLNEFIVDRSDTIEEMMQKVFSSQKRFRQVKEVEISNINFEYSKDKLKTIEALKINEKNQFFIKWA